MPLSTSSSLQSPPGTPPPPAVRSTARRTASSGNTTTIKHARDDVPGGAVSPRQQPSRHPSPAAFTISAASSQHPTRRSMSRTNETRRRLRSGSSHYHSTNANTNINNDEPSTLVIAEAEAVVAARHFSFSTYRELHQRHFKSVREELDFLRRDFVASRKTLALLHEDKLRLQRQLLARVSEIEELKGKLEEMYRGEEAGNDGRSRSSTAAATVPRSSAWYASHVLREELKDSLARPRNSFDVADDAKEVKIMTPEVNDEAGIVPTSRSHEAAQQEKGAEAWRKQGAHDTTSETPSLAAHTTVGTPPPLCATATAKARPTASKRASTAGESAANTHELIRDLRTNLARRDTALSEAQMALSAAQQDRQRLRTELQEAQSASLEAKQQRDALQQAATAHEEKQRAQALEIEALKAHVQELAREKEEVQRRLTTAELLYQHTGPITRATRVVETDALVEPGRDTEATGDASEQPYLREQLQMYRAKWQAAEDELEHLHGRLSQLQRQLVQQSGRRENPKAAIAAISSRTSSAGALSRTEQEKETEATAAVAVAVEKQRADYEAELATLRRQHKEQLQLCAEELSRLQRRLDRAQENAAFHEDQLRQQRQEDARQHHSEVQALQSQLRTAQGELVKAQDDREHLARQLRRSTEQETTVEVLRGQVEQLKQRLGEVGTDLAHTRGREKETSLQLQRERMARAKAEHDAEVAHETAQRGDREMAYLQEELKLAREQLGTQEVSAAPPPRGPPPHVLPPFPPSSEGAGSTAGEDRLTSEKAVRVNVSPSEVLGGDAASLASELKGYVALMRVNAALQRRIEELEAHVSTLQRVACVPAAPPVAAAEVVPPAVSNTSPSSPPAEAKGVDETDCNQDSEASRLRQELSKVLEAQQTLLQSWTTVDKERRQLAHDNVTLAAGIEVLEKQLRHSQYARAAAAEKKKNHSVTHKNKSLMHHKQEAPQVLGDPAPAAETSKSVPVVPVHADTHDPSTVEESRLRQRLQSARAQDETVAQEECKVGSSKEVAELLQNAAQPGTAAAAAASTGCWTEVLAILTTSLLPLRQGNLPETNDAPPPPSFASPPVPMRRPDATTAPMPHTTRHHVYGGVLPPVHYPPLVAQDHD